MIVLRALFTARPWRELGYAVTGTLLGLPAFVLALLGIAASALSVLSVGLPVLVGVLAVARLAPRYFRGPARWWLGWTWPAPPPLPGRGPLGQARAMLGDPHGWRGLAYCFAKFPLDLVAAYGGLIVVVLAPVALTCPLWRLVSPTLGGLRDPVTAAGAWSLAAQGAGLLLVLPWFLRLLVGFDRFLTFALLAPSPDSRRIAALEAGRAALQADATAVLRRVERDLHDGTQARLVALGVTLSRIGRRTVDPEVGALVTDARGAVTEALAELRDIVRRLHPPALDDGLAVALGTLAGRSAVPVDVTVELTERPPDATASAAYFTVAELLTNVARHAGATRARLEVREDGPWLRLAVTDNGRGGASLDSAGTGLSGLARRARALDGDLTVDSPPGGPTAVTVALPLSHREA